MLSKFSLNLSVSAFKKNTRVEFQLINVEENREIETHFWKGTTAIIVVDKVY